MDNKQLDWETRLTQAEILFCLAYYGTSKTEEGLYNKVEEMKYSLALMELLQKGEVEYDQKKGWNLTEKGKQAAAKKYRIKRSD